MPSSLWLKNVRVPASGKIFFQSEIEENERRVNSLREQLLMFAAATPRQMSDSEGGPLSWEDHVRFEMNEIMEELYDAHTDLFILRCAQDFPDDVTEEGV